jgi:hypothetical protein
MLLQRLIYILLLFFTLSNTCVAEPNSNTADVFVEATVTSLKPYVQSQVLYTVRVYYGVTINNGGLTDPVAGDAIVKRLSEAQSAQVRRNGRPYNVIERRYAILPQTSGKLIINPTILTGEIREGATRAIRVASNAVTLDVQAKPTGVSGDWLPAQMLTLQESWSAKEPFREGEPVTRTLIINAIGVSGEQLPHLDQASTVSGINSYSAQPVVKTDAIHTAVTGQRIDNIALIPARSGSMTFPVVSVKWWSTQTGKQEVASLPARTIKVLSAVGNAQPQSIAPPLVMVSNQEEKKTVSKKNIQWILSAIFFAACAITVILSMRLKRDGIKLTTKMTLRAAKKSLKKACLKDDLQKAKTAFLQWAILRWSDKNPLTLGACVECAQSETFKKELQAMDAWIYAEKEHEWDGLAFWKAFEEEQKLQTQTAKKTRKAAAEKEKSLPPLNPSL